MSAGPFSDRRFQLWVQKISIVAAPLHLRRLGPCWLWTASLDGDGYPRFFCPDFPAIDGGVKASHMVLAHRWGLAYFGGVDALRGNTSEHQCRRHACVSPDHNMPLDLSTNVARGNALRHVPISEPVEFLDEFIF